MEQKITFNIETEDKKLIKEQARKNRLSVSSYCRLKVLNKLFEKASSGNLGLKELEDFKGNKEGGEENV